jgi:hypothetical protein
MAASQFSLGVLHGWHGIALGLLAAVIFMISGWQDMDPNISGGSTLWFILALTITVDVIWLGVGAKIWAGALLGATFFCLEVWLIWRWWRQGQSL